MPRIFKRIRPGFRYARSLEVITKARESGLVTKSNLILGMGETPDEVAPAMQDLVDAGCEILTITQYLRPSPRHHPVDRWVKPEEFVEHSKAAEAMGFAGVMAGPLVRSSYRAGRLYAQTKGYRGEVLPENLQHLARRRTRSSGSRVAAGAVTHVTRTDPSRGSVKWAAWPWFGPPQLVGKGPPGWDCSAATGGRVSPNARSGAGVMALANPGC